MFGLGLATKVYVAVEAVDMRKGQTLWSHMPDAVGSSECTVFVCRNFLQEAGAHLKQAGKVVGLLIRFAVRAHVAYRSKAVYHSKVASILR